MEYYSAIKKNTFESVLMKWMKHPLRPALSLRGQATAWECSPGSSPGKAGISGLHSRLPRGVRPRLEVYNRLQFHPPH